MPSTKAIIIGAGPSVKKYDHLERLRISSYNDLILCTDYMLVHALQAGITPERFPNFYVFAVEDSQDLIYCFKHDIIDKYASKIKCILNSVDKGVIEQCNKLFQQVIMFDDIPQTQVLGNVGDITYLIAVQVLKADMIAGIGYDHSFESIPQGFPEDMKELFWKKYTNPITNKDYWLNPIYDYYTRTFKEYLSMNNLTFYNLSEQGSLYGDNIKMMGLEEFVTR